MFTWLGRVENISLAVVLDLVLWARVTNPWGLVTLMLVAQARVTSPWGVPVDSFRYLIDKIGSS